MKKILLISLLLAPFAGRAQTKKIYFNYDGLGNRVKKYLSVQRIPDRKAVSGAAVPDTAQKYHLKVYPNPAKEQLTIETDVCPPDVARRIVLYDLNGNKLTEQAMVQCSQALNTGNYPAGVYLLWVLLGNEKTIWKIIIQ